MPPKEDECILQCDDYTKKLVVFDLKNYNKHRKVHRELEDSSFCPDRISRALKNPTFTIPSKKEGRFCYYLEEYKFNGVMKYTKVVVISLKTFNAIVTAFRTDHIKELKYGHAQQFL